MRHLATSLLFILLVVQCHLAHAHALSFDQARKLVWEQSPTLLGTLRDNTYLPDALVSEAIGLLMSVPADAHDIGDGLTIVSGCQWHDCTLKSAAILDTDSGRMQAAALRHFRCRNERAEPTAPTVCDRQASLLIVLIRPDSAARAPAAHMQATILNRLREWAGQFGYQQETIRNVTPAR